MIVEKLDGIRATPLPEPEISVQLRDIGFSYLGEYMGGCHRAAYYKVIEESETNPAARRLVISRHIDLKIRDLYIDMIQRASKVLHTRVEWTIGEKQACFNLDCIYKDNKAMVGVMIFTGSGYGFRSEVFGSKKTAGHPKTDHMAMVWSALATCPFPLQRIELLYIDRDRLDEAAYTVSTTPIDSKVVTDFINSLWNTRTLPPCSYQKIWMNREQVAKLYANKEISKAKYEAWMATQDRGDWHCEYCPFRKRCEEDGET